MIALIPVMRHCDRFFCLVAVCLRERRKQINSRPAIVLCSLFQPSKIRRRKDGLVRFFSRFASFIFSNSESAPSSSSSSWIGYYIWISLSPSLSLALPPVPGRPHSLHRPSYVRFTWPPSYPQTQCFI